LQPICSLGARENIKITTREDLEFAEHWLKSQMELQTMRIGIGYDIHRLVTGRKLILGGVEVESDLGLLGHSDADVMLHAICDALLGAAGLPDIGHYFPNDDSAFKDANSINLLGHVNTELISHGYTIGNIDCSLIAERPKIAPYIPEMKRKISEVLNIDISNVGIKATTNEGVGSLGAGEAIACHAVATIYHLGDESRQENLP
jgi:2-C-methyl-D-erythritol 2,4-cyclodiphosphate synthase